MNQTSKRTTSILIAIGLIVVAIVVFLEMIQPEYATVMKLKGQAASESTLLDTATHSVQQVQQLVDSYKAQSQNAASVSLAMPTGQDVAGAVAQVYGIAQNSAIMVQSIGVSTPALQTLGGQSTSTQIVKPLGTVMLQITGGGTYESLKNFLTGIESNIRIFDLKSISITPAQTGQGTPAVGAAGAANSVALQNFFTYNMTVATYYQTQ